jgi:hypothetical protein
MRAADRALAALGADPQQRHRACGQRQGNAKADPARPVIGFKRIDFMELRPRETLAEPRIRRPRIGLRGASGSGKAT